ncbi:STE-domain-containing protein [Lentinus tigrinus ALCF2SS1-7]|uniref:STE-domain-containing protein n=1 Tax=Lentinus tigrinus ALCF2SS1-7 TaxID=1328758 RepID=UPI001165E610|nr:STE-domain-containing protein [Lentinus tigrinus ALCF2SS1-7]
MEGVLSQHPHFATPDAYPSRSYAPASLYDNSYLQQSRYAPTHSLQIQTAAPAPHEHEPEEQTAHPSRSSTTYPPIPQDGQNVDIEPQEKSIADALTDNPGPYGGLSRPLTLQERELLAHLDRLKFFLATAPSRWNPDNGYAGPDPSTVPAGHPHSPHPALNRFLLPNSEYVSCVLWGGLYHITGTDIVRALVFRFEAFGRPVRNMKKFEEGVFSDLRNLKPGVDACLEEPKSPFLDLLFKYQCIRTQKKQKVFYWFSVPHDRLFLDALERDLKREKMGLEPTTIVTGEPALSFTYDPKRSLYEQFSKAQGHREGEGELEAAVRHADEHSGEDSQSASEAEHSASETDDAAEEGSSTGKKKPRNTHSPFFSMFSLFEGSPTYKQRRKKVPKARRSPTALEMGIGGAAFGGLYGAAAFREPHLDRFGREILRLSAEDLFNAQARGDFGGQSNPDLVATQKERQRRALEALSSGPASAAQGKLSYLNGLGVSGLSGPGVAGSSGTQASVYDVAAGQLPVAMAFQPSQTQQPQPPQQFPQQMGGRPHIEQRHTYPMLDYSQQQQQQQQPHMPVRSDTDPYSGDVAGWTAGVDMLAGGPGAPRTKAFVCPLFSCGRMFKRMEHLKRHLRTHTLERPFQCERCQKRFSRSDNLAQHVRTHDRRAAAAASGMVTPEGEQEPEEELMIDELESLGDADDVDAQLRYLPGVKGITSVRMCEVEVQGQVHEVQGDEEGLVTTTGAVNPSMAAVAAAETSEQVQQQPQPQQPQQEMYYDPSAAAVQYTDPTQQQQVLRASPETSPYMNATTSNSPEAQWATVADGSQHPSPAGSVASGFQTSTGLALQHQQRLDASYHTHPGTMGEYVTSISAPSHKLTFDHSSLYPPEVVAAQAHSQQQGAGPIRRHRSATPSVVRYGESIRRPYSAALSESGQGTHSPRSYHPYAVPGHHHPHSAQSSPMAYTVPLGYDATQQAHPQQHQRPQHARSSSAGMMVDAYGYSGPVRTDSPMQMQYATATAATGAESYEMDIQQPVASMVQDVQGLYVGMEAQYAGGQQMATGYFPHPHHSL